MIESVLIKNFKGIHQMEWLSLQRFSTFIGNNGTGKSAIMEALRLIQASALNSVQSAFSDWGGLEKVRSYQSKLEEHQQIETGFVRTHDPISITIWCNHGGNRYHYGVDFNVHKDGDYLVVESEFLRMNSISLFEARIVDEKGTSIAKILSDDDELEDDETEYWDFENRSGSILLHHTTFELLPYEARIFRDYVRRWQFLFLVPLGMGLPFNQNRLEREIKLDYRGRNLAEYLLWLRNQGSEHIDSLISKLKFVTPYMDEIQPLIRDGFNKQVDLRFREKDSGTDFLPGWLMSSGTLRILALLAMFEAPGKPSVLFVDEIENGLDPRTLGLLLSEIENEYNAENGMQVIATTHSPYLLDQLPLSSVIVTDKGETGGTTFTIPDNDESLAIWKEKFSPGKLYTMGKFKKPNS